MLGGSNCVVGNGIQAGLRQDNIKLTNLALGASYCLQRLYELKREKNKQLLKEADFIIFETNINTIHQTTIGINLATISKHFALTLNELHKLNKNTLLLMLPFQNNITQENRVFITQLHLF
ncbi:MAG: hypothetical protein PUB96_04875, partial [Helicobacteraceae bacterium]|nr:hypothetical protein [Helicobacteraceae bacterium]